LNESPAGFFESLFVAIYGFLENLSRLGFSLTNLDLLEKKMKSVRRNGYVYPQIVPLRVRLKHIFEGVSPPPGRWAQFLDVLERIFTAVFRAPRFYTQEEKTKKGGYYL
jgi:hypothetical protein